MTDINMTCSYCNKVTPNPLFLGCKSCTNQSLPWICSFCGKVNKAGGRI